MGGRRFVSKGERGGSRSTPTAAAPSRRGDSRWQPGSSGRSLGEAEQTHYGSLLGFDFSRIRIHHDPARAHAAGAAAYAIGDHIVGARDPLPAATLGHELAHVAQWHVHGVATETVEGRDRAERNA